MSWRNIQSLSGVTKPNGKIKQIAETKTVSAIFVISLSGRIKHIVGLRGVQFVNRGRQQNAVELLISTVEPLFQARDFIFAYDNLCIGVLRKNYLDLAVEPVGNPLDRRYVNYLLAGRPEKLQRIELRVNIFERHVDVILPLVFKIEACKS